MGWKSRPRGLVEPARVAGACQRLLGGRRRPEFVALKMEPLQVKLNPGVP